MYGLAVIRQNAFLLIVAPPAGERVKRLQNTKFFTRPDMSANFPDFSCMFRGAKRRFKVDKIIIIRIRNVMATHGNSSRRHGNQE